MNRTYSRYKIFGGFGLLVGLNLLIGFGTFTLLTASKFSCGKVDFAADPNALYAYSIVIGLNVVVSLLLMTQSEFVIADSDGITFINPVLPMLRRKRLWTDFDYFILVD